VRATSSYPRQGRGAQGIPATRASRGQIDPEENAYWTDQLPGIDHFLIDRPARGVEGCCADALRSPACDPYRRGADAHLCQRAWRKEIGRWRLRRRLLVSRRPHLFAGRRVGAWVFLRAAASGMLVLCPRLARRRAARRDRLLTVL